MKWLLGFALLCWPVLAAAQFQPGPNNSVGLIGRDSVSGLPCYIGTAATCGLPASGGSGGGGPATLAAGSVAAGAFLSGSVLSGAYAAGSIVDLTTFKTANHTDLGLINTTLGSPFQVGGSIGNTSFGATAALNAYVDGSIVTLGLKSDAATCAINNTAMACYRQIDADILTLASAPLPAGTNGIGGLVPLSSGGLSIKSVIVGANVTSIAVDASPGQIYGITAYSISAATPVYLKFYNAAQGSTTCGSGTPVQREMVPASGTGGSGVVIPASLGLAYSTAISLCVTGGIADNDTTNPAASSYLVNVYYH